MKRLGLMTSGGDCAGLNAAIRAVVHRAHSLGYDIVGIRNSSVGLLKTPPDIISLTPQSLEASLVRRGGTFLGSVNKGHPSAFTMPDGSTKNRLAEIGDAYTSLGLEAVIVIGGDGSLGTAKQIAKQCQWNLVAIPKTIDNDLGSTDQAIGFNTAVEVATEALDRLQPTAASHERIMVLEVMGRHAGHIALHAGIAGGADVILIPEIYYTFDKVCAHLNKIRESGRNFALVIVAEAAGTEEGRPLTLDKGGRPRYGGIGHYISETISKRLSTDTRVTVLGHVQRGAQPTAVDRIIASAMGVHAVDLVQAGQFDRMVSWQHNTVTSFPIDEAIKKYRGVDPDSQLIQTARGLGICLGD
jgi:phosphofructokinase-like protein